MSKRSESRELFLNLLRATGKTEITSVEIKSLYDANGLTFPQWFNKPDNGMRIKRGLYRVPVANPTDTAVEIGRAHV